MIEINLQTLMVATIYCDLPVPSGLHMAIISKLRGCF